MLSMMNFAALTNPGFNLIQSSWTRARRTPRVLDGYGHADGTSRRRGVHLVGVVTREGRLVNLELLRRWSDAKGWQQRSAWEIDARSDVASAV